MRKVFHWVCAFLAVAVICSFISDWITGKPADFSVWIWAIGGAVYFLAHNIRALRSEA